jgi:hypothetical protein
MPGFAPRTVLPVVLSLKATDLKFYTTAPPPPHLNPTAFFKFVRVCVWGAVYYRKAQRLSWFGHLHQIPEERMVKKSIQVETDVKKTTRETKEQMGR